MFNIGILVHGLFCILLLIFNLLLLFSSEAKTTFARWMLLISLLFTSFNNNILHQVDESKYSVVWILLIRMVGETFRRQLNHVPAHTSTNKLCSVVLNISKRWNKQLCRLMGDNNIIACFDSKVITVILFVNCYWVCTLIDVKRRE